MVAHPWVFDHVGLLGNEPPRVGIPAELLRRRPDVRRAEREVASQSAQIGIAQSDLYPHISITGTIGYSAQQLNELIQPSALDGFVGPTLQWNLLNYGRIVNNVMLQDARFMELVAAYQATVLSAGQEVEDGLVMFLQAQYRARSLAASVDDADKAVKYSLDEYRAGTVDFTRVTLLQQNLVTLQDTWAQSQGEIALGLIQVYRAAGGGWQIRILGCDPAAPPAPGDSQPREEALPVPRLLPPLNQPESIPNAAK